MSARREESGRGERGSRLVVRGPNHLGDLLMALPAIQSLQPADVIVPRWLVPVLELANLPGEAIPFERGARGLSDAARVLRARRYDRGVLLAPSFSAALMLTLGGVPERRGARTDGRGFMITDPVPDSDMAGLHRSATYHVLATGRVPDTLPAPRLGVPERLRGEWRDVVAANAPWRGTAERERGRAGEWENVPVPAAAALAGAPPLPRSHSGGVGWAAGLTIGLFPGSNAPSRRWDAARFAELARRLAAGGARVVVFGGAGERELTRAVAGDVAFDAGGRTNLPLLAAGLAWCDLVVTNDSGPMHLAAAVGARTVSLQGASDPRRTRPLGAGHILLQHAELPCVPCVRNECPRRGAGTFLPEASGECLRLISVDEVEAAARGAVAAVPD